MHAGRQRNGCMRCMYVCMLDKTRRMSASWDGHAWADRLRLIISILARLPDGSIPHIGYGRARAHTGLKQSPDAASQHLLAFECKYPAQSHRPFTYRNMSDVRQDDSTCRLCSFLRIWESAGYHFQVAQVLAREPTPLDARDSNWRKPSACYRSGPGKAAARL